jgi:CheY-like chemotaxis protein
VSIDPSNLAARKRLLIADDEPGIRELLSDILSAEGYSIETAASGDDAIARIREQRFDLALVDLLMPGSSGADVARVIANESPQTIVVIVTGSDETTVENMLGGTKVDQVVTKPFEMDEILQVVSALTGGPS